LNATLAVALGGAIGSVARYWVAAWTAPFSRSLPVGTIIINIAGSFAISLFATLTMTHGRHPASDTTRLFVMAGLCGGFTTFSAFSLQTLDLLRGGAPWRALGNVAVSVAACVAAAAAGYAIAARINGPMGVVAAADPACGSGATAGEIEREIG
jgi:CrcB protein